MKRIFFFALASLALASCTDDEEIVAQNGNAGNKVERNVLGFSAYTAGKTRATDVTSATLVGTAAKPGSGFMVAAKYDDELFFREGTKASVDKTTSTDDIFDTDEYTYYWPTDLSDTKKMGFRAFNDKVGAAWLSTEVGDKTFAEYERISFPVAAKASEQKDLVVAYAETTTKPTNGVQPLNFVHALAKVNFTFKGLNYRQQYTINKVELIAAGANKNDAGTAINPIMSFAETTEIAANGSDGNQPETNAQKDKISWAFTAIDGTNPLVAKNDVVEGISSAAQGVLYSYDKVDAAAAAKEIVIPIYASQKAADDGTEGKRDYNFMLLPQKGKIALRVYYKVEEKGATAGSFKVVGNCGYTKTDEFGRHEGDAKFGFKEDGTAFDQDIADAAIYGCKTLIIDLGDKFKDGTGTAVGLEAGKAYRFTVTLPTDDFLGDKSGDGVADMDKDNDLDGDGDNDASEFGNLTPIRFSVTVSNWEDEKSVSNITIK